MTNSEFAILSMLLEQPRYGYELEQVIETRGVREWTEIGFSSIYSILKRLEQAGLIDSRLEQPGGRGPARKVYTVTPEGRAAARQATLEALSVPHRCYPPLQLGLANLPVIGHREAMNALREHRAGLSAQYEHLQRRWSEQKPLPYFVEAMFAYSQNMIQAEIHALDRVIELLEARGDENDTVEISSRMDQNDSE